MMIDDNNAAQTATVSNAQDAHQTPDPSTMPQTASQPSAATTQPSASQTVTNAPATPQPVHPSVAKAGIIHDIARSLAGNPTQTTIDPTTGTTTRTPVPLSTKQIGLAIALEALSGGITGLAQRGPNATAQAAAAGYQQGQQQLQQAKATQEQQAQQQFENESKALVQRASTYETNSRTLLNTAQAQRLGEDAVKDLVSINRASGVLDVDPALLENNGVPMTEGELVQAMRDGSINATSHLGPVAGYTMVNGPDGQSQIQTTHLVIKDPNARVPLTQQMWDTYANADVPGFKKGANIGDGTTIPLRMLQGANERLGERTLTDHKLNDLRSVLDGTQWADKVPAKVDFSQPGVDRAMTAFSRYQSHDAENAGDPYLALKVMGTAKRNADGTIQPNPDAKYADVVATVMGGWPLLETAHNQLDANRKAAADFTVIDSEAKANGVLASPKRFTGDQIASAKAFLALSQQQGERKTADEARQRAIATGADVEAMYRYGVNPVTKERLSLDNAPDSMLVTPSGEPVPQNQQALWKPTAQEKQTADTARQVLAISAGLQGELQKNPNLAGPLSGRSKAAIAKLGYGDAQSQKFLDDLTFLQSAATKMHTGRFSNEILKKMGTLIQPGMNADQFNGALSSINGVASRYADEDRLRTVGEFKQSAPQNPTPQGGQPAQIPAGAQIGRDAKGNVVGYKLPNGTYVPLGGR